MSVSNDKRRLSDTNKVKGSPAIMYSSIRCDSDQHEPLVRPEVQRQQRLDLQRQQRQSQQQQRQQHESLSGGRDFTDI
jgi:hypothetical protein